MWAGSHMLRQVGKLWEEFLSKSLAQETRGFHFLLAWFSCQLYLCSFATCAAVLKWGVRCIPVCWNCGQSRGTVPKPWRCNIQTNLHSKHLLSFKNSKNPVPLFFFALQPHRKLTTQAILRLRSVLNFLKAPFNIHMASCDNCTSFQVTLNFQVLWHDNTGYHSIDQFLKHVTRDSRAKQGSISYSTDWKLG